MSRVLTALCVAAGLVTTGSTFPTVQARRIDTAVHPIIVPGFPVAVTIFSYFAPLNRNPATNHNPASTPSKVVVIRSRSQVRRLVVLLNSLVAPPSQRAIPCPFDNGSHDKLAFRYRGGRRWKVDVQIYGCRFARSRGAVALPSVSANNVYRYLAKLLGEPAAYSSVV